MGEVTTIAWCHHTLNFWEGCTKISPGCDNCYAAARDARFHASAHWGVGAPRRERLVKACEEARRLNRKAKEAGERRRVFVNSLSDFFDNEVPAEWLAYALGVMRACDWLDFLVLTKRIGNAPALIATWNFWPLRNLWLGITVVNQEEVRRDVAKLLDVHAHVRFLSCEPLLASLNVAGALSTGELHWIIVGGESGHHARAFNVEWARELIRQCRGAGVPVFCKQIGSRPMENGQPYVVPGKGDDPQYWPPEIRVQEFLK